MTGKNKNQKSIQPSITFVLGGLTGGGAERVAVTLMNMWVEKGYQITLISMRGPAVDVYPISDKVNRLVLGGEGESSNKLIGLLKNVLYVKKLRQAIKSANSKNVVSFLTRANLYAILACAGLNKKVIISERNDISKQPLRWPWPFLRTLLYKYADVVTANSKVALQSMKPYVAASKLHYIPNPVQIPKESATPEKSMILLNVARLTSHKRQADIINAFKLIENDFPEWSLVILGEGEERGNLTKLAKSYGMENCISLPGFVQTISDFYTSSAIFVLPSEYEGTPNALLESMSYGIPSVVADSLPGAVEQIKHNETGLIYEGGNIQDLSEKLKYLMNEPELRKSIGRSAREYVEKYSPETILNVWDTVLSK